MQALNDGTPSSGYPDLPGAAREEWELLENAITSAPARGRLLFAKGAPEVCPNCYIALPSHEIQKLQSTGIGMTKSCCHKVIICAEE